MIVRRPKAVAVVAASGASTTPCWSLAAGSGTTAYIEDKTSATAVTQTNNDGVLLSEIFTSSTATEEINYITINATNTCTLLFDFSGGSLAGIDISAAGSVDTTKKAFLYLTSNVEKTVYLPRRTALNGISVKGYAASDPTTYWEIGLATDVRNA